MINDDILSFDDDVPSAVSSDDSGGTIPEPVWNVLIVDDDEEVHAVTRLALKGFSFGGRTLHVDSAYSASDAKELMKKERRYAIALLDVVMETDHAGLSLVKWIREELDDHHVRLILRTGQPGQAPEREVIASYDINDYKEKTELTANKLYTLMCSSLRSYRDMVALYKNKMGLETVIQSTTKMFSHQSMDDFTQGALQQLSALLHLNTGAVYSEISTLAAAHFIDENKVLAATGRFSDSISESLESVLSETEMRQAKSVLQYGGQIFGDHYFIGVYDSKVGRKHLLFLEGFEDLSDIDKQLIQIFGQNVGVAFDNHFMFEEVELTQREMVYRLSEAVENRSQETGNHVKRMALSCKVLGKAYGLSERDVEILYKAAPLHDIGKIAIPDHILNKPGKLEPAEWEIMQTHAQIGYDILSSSELEVLKAGATISAGHHENWDGSGYPKGVSGKNIPVFARIAAVADVFDALVNKRCYKDAWRINEVNEFFEDMKGVKFEPALVDLMFEYQADLMTIQKNYPD